MSNSFTATPSALNVWNFMAFAPASFATSIKDLAKSISPLWFIPASAIIKQGSPFPINLLPILTFFVLVPR